MLLGWARERLGSVGATDCGVREPEDDKDNDGGELEAGDETDGGDEGLGDVASEDWLVEIDGDCDDTIVEAAGAAEADGGDLVWELGWEFVWAEAGMVCDIVGARETVCGSEWFAREPDGMVVVVVAVAVVVVVGGALDEEVCRALPLTMAAQDMMAIVFVFVVDVVVGCVIVVDWY